MSDQPKPVLHAGADWLTKYVPKMSPMGIRVANVLGQTYRGIYHIDDHVLKHKDAWSNQDEISVTIYGELATYDFPELTILSLCCQKAGLLFDLSGSFKGYTKITFYGMLPPKTPAISAIEDPENMKDFADCIKCLLGVDAELGTEAFINTHKKARFAYQNKEGRLISLAMSLPNHDPECVNYAITCSHYSSARISFRGLSPRSLEVHFSERLNQNGATWSRHLTPEQAIEAWRPYYDVDFTQIGLGVAA